MTVMQTRMLVALPAMMALLVHALSGSAAAQPPPAAAPQEHATQYAAADVAVGQRLYGSLCAGCHGPTGAGVAGIDLRRGPLPRAATDDALRALITKGLPTSGMPAFRLEPAELTGLVAFIRSGFEGGASVAVALGDTGRGKAIVEGKGNCLACHRLGDRGAFGAPDLTEIGRLRQPAALQRSLLDPTGSMQPINRPVRAVTRSGAVIEGRRLNEDQFTVQIISTDGRLVSFVKSELRDWSVSTTSTMPSYQGTLTAAEIADVVAYLASLKGGRP